MSTYDIGVFGVWYGKNYGSVATYYALNTLLSSMGKSVLMLDKPRMRDTDTELADTHSRRFAGEHYHISRSYAIDELPELNDLCDGFMVGSDQLWNYSISRGTQKTFYLDFADDSKRKIAFATSFGHAIDFAPPEERVEIAKYMARFDGISLREDDGVEICRNDYGIYATQVLDPVFLVDPSLFTELGLRSAHRCEEPFLAAYILDPTPEKRSAILHLAKKLGNLKIFVLLDGAANSFEEARAAMDLPNCVENAQVEDWLYFLSHARYVVTDSFHGAGFSIIFQRNFTAICNKMRGFSRFESLSRMLPVGDHIVTNPGSILNNPMLLEPLDYDKINKALNAQRERSIRWLDQALNGKKKSVSQLIDDNVIGTLNPRTGGRTVTSNLDTRMCVGCGACAAACPRDAISLRADEWGYFRAAVDYDRCDECGLCMGACPALSLPATGNSQAPSCHEFVPSDSQALRRRSDGGVFTSLAKLAFAMGGAVAGPAWTDAHTAEHIVIESERELYRLLQANVLQSCTGDCFRRVRALLDGGRFVLFTGAPCQAAGLRKFLGRDYDNLLTVDLLCDCAPSAMFYKKYLEEARGGEGPGEELSHALSDEYRRAFRESILCPWHCERCRYRTSPRVGDLTMEDFRSVDGRDPARDAGGVPLVLCGSEKGARFWARVFGEELSVRREVSPGRGGGQEDPGERTRCTPARDAFYNVIRRYPFREAIRYSRSVLSGDLREAFEPIRTPLLYDVNTLRFLVPPGVREEHTDDGSTLLTAASVPGSGTFAALPLNYRLKKGRPYRISARVRVCSGAGALDLMVGSRRGNARQAIGSLPAGEGEDAQGGAEISAVFRPDAGCYDRLLLSPDRPTGGSWRVVIDYISISQEPSGAEG